MSRKTTEEDASFDIIPFTDENTEDHPQETEILEPNIDENTDHTWKDVVYEDSLEQERPLEEIPSTLPSPDSESSPTLPENASGHQKKPPTSILTIEVGSEVETQQIREEAIWHEIRNSQITRKPLTGILSMIEHLDNGNALAIVYFKGFRIVIPLSEMMLLLLRPEDQSDQEYNERQLRVLSKMVGAEIDFIIRGTDEKTKSVVASRKAAMIRHRRKYYFTNDASGLPKIYPGRTVEARIISVNELAIRVEVFGVESTIKNQYLSWSVLGDVRERFVVGNTVVVRVQQIYGDSPANLRITADIRSLTPNTRDEALENLKLQSNCIGRVTEIRSGVILIALVNGVSAIAHSNYDKRTVGRGDDVVFVVTKKDEESGVAIGLVSRILKQNI